MIYYDHLPLDKDILDALGELKIDYVFQPIFKADGKTLFAREALMRPADMNVMELIEKYNKLGKLHVLEVATFFGAMQAYHLRGYECKICMNSFPSELFTLSEQKAFAEYFGDMNGRGIIEILEYPYISEEAVEAKRIATSRQGLWISIDDFGTGINNMDVVKMYDTKIVKLDRHLISGIDHLPDKQENVKKLIEEFHSQGILVLAEGVEEKEEFECLVDMHIDLFQGYYLGRPM
jgi:EAL domain-containing protein (putative c-di-GMP-specific phosphodiesterase class I)